MKPIIGISIGDLNGIGPEVVLKTVADPRIVELCTPVIFSSTKLLNFYRKAADAAQAQFHATKSMADLSDKLVNVFTCWEEEVTMQPGHLTETGGKYAVRSLQVAAQCLKDGELHALVTAPIHKSNTRLPDFPYTGHTPFLKDFFGAKDVVMLLYSNNGLRVALATEHVPVSGVPALLTPELLNSKLAIVHQTLVRDFGIDKPRIAVLGLNPHAGDGGHIGDEEARVIKPLVDSARERGHVILGPYAADAFFARGSWKEFDAVVAMYHDQGLIPFKTLVAGEGINYTAGLSHIRTSPDHGTAFDIAGQGIADPSSFQQALFAAIDLWRARQEYDEATANPLERKAGKRERER